MNDVTTEAPTSTTQLTPSDLRDAVRTAMDRQGLSIRELALRLGTQHQPLARWLQGDSAARESDTASIEPRLREWLTSEAVASGFIETPTSEKILSALAYAKASQDMVIVYGAPGVGKTETIREFMRRYQNVWHATITPSCAGVVPALEEICEAVGLREISAGARSLSRAIRNRVRDTRGLIVIDEMQHLATSTIEELRSIHDAVGIGIAFVGNETGYGRLTGGQRAAHFAQIYSRLGMRLYVPPVGQADVRLVCARFGLTDLDEKTEDLLVRVAARPGGLRSVTKALRLAQSAVTERGGELTFRTVKRAVDNLGAEA